MKHFALLLALGTLACTGHDTTAQEPTPAIEETTQLAAQDPYLTEMIEKWQNSCAYTRKMIEAMPEEHLEFKPTDGQRTFREQVMHIGGNMIWLGETHLGGEAFEVENEPTTKEELLAYFDEVSRISTETFQRLDASALEEHIKLFGSLDKTKRQVVNLMQDHQTHHRGQVIVYLRLKDITPPRYTGW